MFSLEARPLLSIYFFKQAVGLLNTLFRCGDTLLLLQRCPLLLEDPLAHTEGLNPSLLIVAEIDSRRSHMSATADSTSD